MREYEVIYNEVKKILKPVYLVGGSIRDILLGFWEPKDYDFCCPHEPDEIEEKIKKSINENGDHRRAYLTGKRFGTIGCKILGHKIEITTFRTEKYSKGNRKPQVEFVKDITADLGRRDFTINAIAYRDGKLIDPYGGKMDIMAKIIKAVGKPQERIKEDPLRMLRCARLMSELNFEVDQYLKAQIKKKAYKILHISKERWVQELDRILVSENVIKGLDFLMNTMLINFMIPELALQKDFDQNSEWHNYDLWTHTKMTVEITPSDIEIRLAALLHDIAKPFVIVEKKGKSHYYYHDYLGGEMIEKISRYLKWSNERRLKVKELVTNHLNPMCELNKYDKAAH